MKVIIHIITFWIIKCILWIFIFFIQYYIHILENVFSVKIDLCNKPSAAIYPIKAYIINLKKIKFKSNYSTKYLIIKSYTFRAWRADHFCFSVFSSIIYSLPNTLVDLWFFDDRYRSSKIPGPLIFDIGIKQILYNYKQNYVLIFLSQIL